MTSDNPPPPPRQRLLGLSLDMVVAISALIVSVCAIVVSLVQTSIMERQQAADVWPHLSVGISSDSGASPAVRFQVQNSGVGPALIRWVELRLDDQPMTSWEALGGALTSAETAQFRQVATLNGRVVMAGETVVVHQPYQRQLVDAVIAADDRIGLRVCYCSIQDECWMAQLNDPRDNARVPHCPIPDENTFTQ